MDAEDLKCSLCLDFFTPPVYITTCGHSFCGECLTRMEAASSDTMLFLCPECRSEQEQMPAELTQNFFLERAVEKFRNSRKYICTAHDLKMKLRK